jgi:hypothetical protein
MICAQGWYGIFPVAADSLLLGVKWTAPPPELGSRRDVLTKYGLLGHGELLCWNLRRDGQYHVAWE